MSSAGTSGPDPGDGRRVKEESPTRSQTTEREGDPELQPVLTIEPGRVIDDFRLVKLIGQGGMGQVWEAEQLSLGRKVALKLMRPDRISERTLDLFAREARAGGRLQNPGIVAIYTHGEKDGVAWIAMELVEGCQTLSDLLYDSTQLTELPGDYYQTISELIIEVADALHDAHEAAVIHRDLKPGNILISPEGHPKITDFGLAKITDETALSMTGDVTGTFFYMSPEQISPSSKGMDRRTDVFSLGVVFYQLLTLQRPFWGDTFQQISKKILTEDPTDARAIRSRVPEDLAVICGKCLEKGREQRYQSMADLAADVRRHLADEPILARPPTPVQRAVKWARRHPTKSVSAGISAVAFVMIAVALWMAVVAWNDAAVEAASVKRLSALQDYDDLIARAEKLWPVDPVLIPEYENWIEDAGKLLDVLPQHRDKRAELRATALPWTPDKQQAAREGHAEFPVYSALKDKLASREAALRQRRAGVAVEPPEIDWNSLPTDAAGLNEIVQQLVDPNRIVFGEEARALAIGQRALELAERARNEELYLAVQHSLSQAFFALGRDDDAEEASQIAVDLAADGSASECEQWLADTRTRIADATSREGLDAAEQEVLDLERRVTELSERIGKREWQFQDTDSDAKWWNNQLTKLIGELEGLADEATGLLGSGIEPVHGWGMGRRLAAARHLQEKMMPGADYQVRWRDARPRIAEAYSGLDLPERTRTGLVPLEPDPESGLWEFWHVQTGEEPLRGGDGKLIVTEESGMVLVLLPGGKFWMGAGTDSRNRNYDPIGTVDASPVHEVLLSPFFLSKFEMTQGQWERLTGKSPALFQRATAVPPSYMPDLRHPVENISWLDCKKLLPRAGLTMPSEAQWEYGARAGTDTPWWTGGDRDSLAEKHAANLADQSAREGGADWPTINDWPELRDGHAVHAPVGTYEANAFGIHDVHGNVWEWCLDGYSVKAYEKSARKDPVVPYSAKPNRVDRGGSFKWTASDASSANRDNGPPSNAGSDLGVRPAIWIVPPE